MLRWGVKSVEVRNCLAAGRVFWGKRGLNPQGGEGASREEESITDDVVPAQKKKRKRRKGHRPSQHCPHEALSKEEEQRRLGEAIKGLWGDSHACSGRKGRRGGNPSTPRGRS